MSNLSYSTQCIEQDDIDAATQVLNGTFLAQGPKVKEFEDNLCAYTGAKYAIAFNSATSALQASYLASGIQQDDEIITSPISFVSTSNMMIECGAIPVWCDIKEDGNIDEDKIEKLITSKTKAIVPVHFAGKPVSLEKIHALAKKYKLLVIEDAAHALGSSIYRKKIGSFSDMTIFSFHAIKPITTGEGGAVLTDNEEYAKHLRLIRSHGMVKKDLWNSDMIELGYNFRMPELAGALGVSQLKKLDKFVALRWEISSYYDEVFKDETLFSTQKIEKNQVSSRHLYPILLDRQLHPHKEKIFKELQENGLGIQVHYKPIYQNSFYIAKFGKTSLPVADDFYRSEVSIPCHQKMSLDDAKFVADTLLKILSKYAR
ncbi:MAG: UDP-4-amino-4,6-dideoxy-N-acetyl-beta-L-altrosamine transaminase [Sulfurimonas sp.]|nr:UDP-4-amino-4,6-dideoxy-N-acetyl-beta-L-altrosamine transaminase [Sulfurimonas sp.]